MLYSVYDLQLKQIDWVCNLTDMNKAIKHIRDYVADDHDTTGLSDNDLFIGWEFILFEHKKKINHPCKIEHSSLAKSISNFKIIYPCIRDTHKRTSDQE